MAKTDFFVFLALFGAYIGQPDSHIGWVTLMPFARCILINQEGTHHRPEKSKDEINRIISLIPPNDFKRYSKMKEDVLQMLKKASSC